RWLALLFSVCLQLFSPCAAGQDLITERAWLEDSTGKLQWSEVQRLKATPYEGVLSTGFGSSVIWVRLRIAGTAPNPGLVHNDLVLRIRPVYLDEIQVFDPVAPQGIAGVTGDTQHPGASTLKGKAFLLPLAASEQPRDIWLRVNSTSTRQISATVVRESDLLNLEQTEHLLFALYVCLVTIFSLWGITYWLFTKEKLAGLFGIKQLAALVYALCALGYMRIFWPQTWSAHALDLLSSIFSMVATSAGIYFHLVFLREFKPRPWTVWPLRVLAGMLPVNLGLFFVLDMPRLALQINLSTVLITPFVALLMAVLARGWETKDPRQQPALPRPVVIGFYSLLLLLAAASLPGLGLTKGAEIAIYLVQAHGLASGFLVLLMLQYRAHVLQRQQLQAQQQLERLQLQAEQDRLARLEQEQLLTMLTHELKTPLATMHMRLDARTEGAQDIKRAIREMNAVIERCLQATQLGDQGLQIRATEFNLAALLHDAVAACPAPERVQLITQTQIPLHSDPQLLFIVISNLLENACKYAAPDTAIVVEMLPTSQSTGQAQLLIRNTVGKSGWPDKTKLFEKYYRTPGAQRQAGTGLGLYLVRNLMDKLGGRVDYDPQGQDVRFVLTLPSVR
ncbi:MAG: hypothetical protein RLZ63_2162, partial [Pseudomonadota bacterium]